MPFTYNGNTPNSISFNGNTVSHLKYNGTEVWSSEPPAEIDYFWMDGLVQFVNSSSCFTNLQYSTDKVNWNNVVDYETIVGGVTYFKADNCLGFDNIWFMSDEVYIGGHLSTLYGGTETMPVNFDAAFMFYETSVIDASELVLPEFVCESCYSSMFDGCTSLTTPPVLPATTLATSCYYYMFNGCTSLTTAPALPATTLADYCYINMFYNCSNIKMSETQTGEYTNTFTFGTTPSNDNAAGMFDNTGGTFTGTPTQQTYYTSNEIIYPPDNTDYFWIEPESTEGTLSGTSAFTNLQCSTDKQNWVSATEEMTISQKTYFKAEGYLSNMFGLGIEYNFNIGGHLSTLFSGTNTMPAAFNAKQIFMWQMSLIDASELILPDFVTANCYEDMFSMCESLTTPPALPATTLASECYAGMFSGCTSLTTAPALPATTLAEGCYSSMFSGCTALTSIPALPATTLYGSCYLYMFYNCSNIKMSETQTGEYTNTFTFGTTPSNDNAAGMFDNTGGTFTDTPTQQTYYTSNTIV